MAGNEKYARNALYALLKCTRPSLEALLRRPSWYTQRQLEECADDPLVQCSIETLRIYAEDNPETKLAEIYSLAQKVYYGHEALPVLRHDAELMKSLAG
ncbi:hypothetical protein HY642_04905 [Candidatus Woesearchaeota archaeon]|nr:hypothetical protein [Candidatus Woesearchaeota archaeon]